MYWSVQWPLALGLVAVAVGFLGACGSDTTEDGEPECLSEPASLECDPLYGRAGDRIQPTFHELFDRTLRPTCGASSSCHSSDGAQGGLVLDVEQSAYDGLRGNGSDGKPRIRPGSLSCGKALVRLETPGEPWSMPPGSHLDEPVLCVIRHWIANGAQR